MQLVNATTRLLPVVRFAEAAKPGRPCLGLSGTSASSTTLYPLFPKSVIWSRLSMMTSGYFSKTVIIGGQIRSTESAISWMQMNGRNPLKMSVSEMCGGATDFR